MSLHPSAGARFLLVRQSAPAAPWDAHYFGEIFTPTARFAYQAKLAKSGQVELAPEGEAAPPSLQQKLLSMAKLLARDAAGNAEAGLPAWPERIQRWRQA